MKMKKSRSDVAARYNKDPRLAFVEVGFGHWGEYHTYGTTVQHGVNFPTLENRSLWWRDQLLQQC